jgi:hypothetical protein
MFRSNPKNFGISSLCEYCTVITFCPELATQVFFPVAPHEQRFLGVKFHLNEKIKFKKECSVTIFSFFTNITKCQRK